MERFGRVVSSDLHTYNFRRSGAEAPHQKFPHSVCSLAVEVKEPFTKEGAGVRRQQAPQRAIVDMATL